ncbi:MAG: polysaccharide deacetylase family protein [Firmicutes bacterium]|nr:polysaccharide deacetylase family protein [Bacillota bacterium]
MGAPTAQVVPVEAPAAQAAPVQVQGPDGIRVEIFGLAPAAAARVAMAGTAAAPAGAGAGEEPADALPPAVRPDQALPAFAAGVAGGWPRPGAPVGSPDAGPDGTAAPAAPEIPRPVVSLPLPPADRRVALTFNGLPGAEELPQLLTLLRQAGVQATFFLSGEEVEAHAAAVAALAADGHELGTRGYRAAPMDGLTADAARQELVQGVRAFARAGFGPPRFFRPPGGRFDPGLVEAAGALGLDTVLWSSIGLRPAAGEAAEALADRVQQACFPGAILMLRADRPETLRDLPTVLAALEAAGCQPAPLSRLWGS